MHKNSQWNRLARILWVSAILLALSNTGQCGWRAGVAQADITPKTPVWMAGYGNRNRPADKQLHPLWIKSLALEDEQGHRAIIVSTDTLGIPRTIMQTVARRVETSLQIPPAAVMLNSSHTHCGPVLRSALYDTYPLEAEHITAIEAYSEWLEDQLVSVIEESVEQLAPVTVFVGQGKVDFAVNRRNNLEPEIPRLRADGALKGPVDHAVPILAVQRSDGQWLAFTFGYACHNTTLSFYQWSGDYAGFAQYAMQRRYPGAAALFYMGCGGDQNPLPRRTVELAKQYGERLADAVAREVESGRLQKVEPQLSFARELVPLKFGPAPTRAELEPLAGNRPSYSQRWASRLLQQIDAGTPPFPSHYPYPVQVWRIGRKQLWIALGGEVVVDYALGLKKHYGSDVWVAGYANDVMAYIPSLRVLEEDVPPRASSRWGYEGNTSMMVYGMPCHRWDTSIETTIFDSVERMIKQVRQPLNARDAPQKPRIP